MNKSKLLITGSTGFLGEKLVDVLHGQKKNLKLTLRKESVKPLAEKIIIPYIGKSTNWREAVQFVDYVIHCAARVHVMNDSASNPLEEFREVNSYGTLNLAQQAADAGVKRFIFISSIKVNGESTELDFPFRHEDRFIPTDPYCLSKYEAEIGLRKIAKETGMEVVIIRPPLVYGPGVKANFASMMKWVNKGFPLPLGGIKDNQRSLVSVDNLIDLIVTCIDHPKAADQTFLVSDNEDISTTGLLKNMASALNAPNRLIPIPASWFNIASRLIGKPAISQRLCGSLQVDISKTIEMLNWKPPYSADESMKKTADAYLNNLNRKKEL